MKYRENRKITACVTSDRDSPERENLWILLCVVFSCMFSLYDIVRYDDKRSFFLNLLAQRVSSLKLVLVWQSEKLFYETLGFSLLAEANLWERLRGCFELIKTFKFVACYGTKCSHHIITFTGNLLSAHFLLAAHHQQNIPLGFHGTSSKALIELNCINMTYCMSFQPKTNITL